MVYKGFGFFGSSLGLGWWPYLHIPQTEMFDELISRKLSLNAGEPTILIMRVLIQDEDPIIYHREHLIYDPARPIGEACMRVVRGSLGGQMGRIPFKRGYGCP